MSLQDLLAALGDREAWRAHAACRGLDTKLMYPTTLGRAGDNNSGPAQARAVCNTCTVRAECFNTAVANDERFGVWAGMSGRVLRAAIVRRQRELRTQEMAR